MKEKPKTTQLSLYGQLIAQKLETLDEIKRAVVMNEIDNLLFRSTMKHMGQQSHALYSTNNPIQQYHSNANHVHYVPHNFSLSYQQPAYVSSQSEHSSGVPSPANSYYLPPFTDQNISQA